MHVENDYWGDSQETIRRNRIAEAKKKKENLDTARWASLLMGRYRLQGESGPKVQTRGEGRTAPEVPLKDRKSPDRLSFFQCCGVTTLTRSHQILSSQDEACCGSAADRQKETERNEGKTEVGTGSSLIRKNTSEATLGWKKEGRGLVYNEGGVKEEKRKRMTLQNSEVTLGELTLELSPPKRRKEGRAIRRVQRVERQI